MRSEVWEGSVFFFEIGVGGRMAYVRSISLGARTSGLRWWLAGPWFVFLLRLLAKALGLIWFAS